MSLKQRIIDKAIEAERSKIIKAFATDPVQALAHLLSRCGITYKKNNDGFVVPLNHNDEVVITVKKRSN